jgi:UDP-N-acetylglucosamine acyltransferase
MTIHPTALVDPLAQLGADVEIGPFSIVKAGATIGDRTRVLSHAFIASACDIGPDCEIHMGTVLGHTPQIRGIAPPWGRLVIGAGNIVREQVTIHAASKPGQATRLGSGNFLLAGCHVAHDCQIGDNNVIANGALLAGHVVLGSRAFVSGNAGVHQFVRIGDLAMIGGKARVSKDVPPFMMVVGDSQVRALNVIGLRRAGYSPEERRQIKLGFRILYRSGLNVTHAVERLHQLPESRGIRTLLDFIASSRRGLCAAGPRGRRLGTAEPERQVEEEPVY